MEFSIDVISKYEREPNSGTVSFFHKRQITERKHQVIIRNNNTSLGGNKPLKFQLLKQRWGNATLGQFPDEMDEIHVVTSGMVSLTLNVSIIGYFVAFSDPLFPVLFEFFASQKGFRLLSYSFLSSFVVGLRVLYVRHFIGIASSGPSSAVFVPFFPFAVIRKPILFSRFAGFTSRTRLPIDLGSCIAANLVCQFGNWLMTRPRTQPAQQQEGVHLVIE
jgi:hypothetical protein